MGARFLLCRGGFHGGLNAVKESEERLGTTLLMDGTWSPGDDSG